MLLVGKHESALDSVAAARSADLSASHCSSGGRFFANLRRAANAFVEGGA